MLILTLTILAVIELILKALRRTLAISGLWPPWKRRRRQHGEAKNAEELDLGAWQEMQRDPEIRERLNELSINDHDA